MHGRDERDTGRARGPQSLGAKVIGVSVDTPLSLKEFAQQNDLGFRLVSDHSKQLINSYDISVNFDDIGFQGVAERSIFVVDDGDVVYEEIVGSDTMPDLEQLKDNI